MWENWKIYWFCICLFLINSLIYWDWFCYLCWWHVPVGSFVRRTPPPPNNSIEREDKSPGSNSETSILVLGPIWEQKTQTRSPDWQLSTDKTDKMSSISILNDNKRVIFPGHFILFFIFIYFFPGVIGNKKIILIIICMLFFDLHLHEIHASSSHATSLQVWRAHMLMFTWENNASHWPI